MSNEEPGAATGDGEPKFDVFSKANRWYYKELGDHLQPASRRLLEDYCGIAPEDINAHVLQMVSNPLPLLLHINQLTLFQRDSLWSSAP
jgi:hypothetical protein